jgi:hypothetical protein
MKRFVIRDGGNALRSLSVGLLAGISALTFASGASATSRDEVMTRARAYAAHPWSATTPNLTASCSAMYKSVYTPGDFIGVAYNWGGYQTLAEFDQNIAKGLAAGAQPSDGVLACTAGVDCSGFVSKAWNVGHFTTSSLDQTSAAIMQADMLPGDVYNMAGYHVAMWSHNLASGSPVFVEAYGYNVNVDTTGGMAHVSGYTPRRLNGITGTTDSDPMGTPTKPIAITAFPYSDARNTKDSTSSVFDVCGAAPTKQEAGSEYVYTATFTQPGTLTLAVSDDATTDVDVELYTTLQTNACTARGDTTLTQTVGCGTYYAVVDTFGPSTNVNAGPYQFTATFTPSGQPCSAVPGPPAFSPKGKMGDACGYPGNPNLPFCNPNLGADTCVYGSSSSFCSKPCVHDSECGDLPGGGCCEELSKGEFYCVEQSMCGGATPQTAGDGGASTNPADGGAGTNGGDGTGTGSGSGSGAGDTADPNGDGTDPGAAGAGAHSHTVTSGGCNAAPNATGDSAPDLGGLVAFGLALSSVIARRRRAAR